MHGVFRSRWAALAVGLLAIPIVYFVLEARPRGPVLSLVDAYPTTIKRSIFPDVEAFSVYDASLAGESKRAVYARAPSRITWKLTVPAAAELRLWLGLRSEAWAIAGDGVVFRVGVSDRHGYRELLTQMVNPYHAPADRRWIPAALDLSPFAGQTVDLIFNTDRGPAQNGTQLGDLALWGEPHVVAAR
jgi:hypothetical protein